MVSGTQPKLFIQKHTAKRRKPMSEKRFSFSEFNAYNKCPLLWDNVYRKKNTVTKPISYRELAFKYKSMDINVVGYEDVYAKAMAIRQYMDEIKSDTIFVLGNLYVKDDSVMSLLENNKLSFIEGDTEMTLPIPEVYCKKNNNKEKIILATIITSSSTSKPTQNTLAHFQRMALVDAFNNLECDVEAKEVKIAIRIIKTASLKMKKAETDEEFEARRAELIKKSKTGTSKAQKQLGETPSEFFNRYKDAITHSFEMEDEYFLKSETQLINKLKCFVRDRTSDSPLAFNDYYCPYCDYNKGGVCKSMLGMSDTDTTECGNVSITAND